VATVLQPATKGERVAARIRAAALEQFSRLGFERATMGEIAREAGVSQATLHYHFQDKAQLWRSAMLDLESTIAEEERAIAAAADAPAIAQLRMAMRLFVEISWRHPALGRIVALEGMAGGERLAWLVDNLLGERNRRLARLAARAIAEGDLKPFPPEQIVVTLQAAAAGLINLQPLMRANFGVLAYSQAGRDAHLEMILSAVFDGFVTRKTEETQP
jgi:AcrR family transcriptional regulator